MTALRMRARDFLTEEQLIEVRRRSTWKGAALIAHAWALILAAIALVAWGGLGLIFATLAAKMFEDKVPLKVTGVATAVPSLYCANCGFFSIE